MRTIRFGCKALGFSCGQLPIAKFTLTWAGPAEVDVDEDKLEPDEEADEVKFVIGDWLEAPDVELVAAVVA